MSSVKYLTSCLEELKLVNSQLKTRIQVKTFEHQVVWKKIHTMEQQYFSRYIEIFGIPKLTNEDCFSIVRKIGLNLGIELKVINAYKKVENVGSKSTKIVAELQIFAQKKRLMVKIKRMGLYASQLNDYWPATRIFVNDYLTPHYRDLFYKCRLLGKTNNYKFIWYRNMEIRVQKDESSEVFKIQQHSDLLKIV